ncbi:MAG: hypothetical protein ACRDRT_02335, partial [Pseudonocardiaceae bacterium]
ASLDTSTVAPRADLVGVGWLAAQGRRAAQKLTRAEADAAGGGEGAIRMQQPSAVGVPVTKRAQVPGHHAPRSQAGQR